MNVPSDKASCDLDQLLQTPLQGLPSRSYFEDFRLSITKALEKQQADLSRIELEKERLNTDKEALRREQERMEKKREEFSANIKKFKGKEADLIKANKLLEERETLLY